MYMMHTYFKQCDSVLFQYGILFMLRKNSVKLDDLVKKSKKPDIARDYIVFLKYIISKCDPDFLKVLVALAVDYENIKSMDFRYALYDDAYAFHHMGTSFRFHVHARLYTEVVEGAKRLTSAEPYMLLNLDLNGYEMQANESELYLFGGIMIAQAQIQQNDMELRRDLSRRTGIENVMKKYAELEVKTDDTWSIQNGSN